MAVKGVSNLRTPCAQLSPREPSRNWLPLPTEPYPISMWLDKVLSFNRKKVPQAISAYALDERRTDNYTFTSMKVLQAYFATWLPEEKIEEMVESAKTGFVIRQDSDEHATRLQFLKKCEYSMVRLLRSGAAA